MNRGAFFEARVPEWRRRAAVPAAGPVPAAVAAVPAAVAAPAVPSGVPAAAVPAVLTAAVPAGSVPAVLAGVPVARPLWYAGPGSRAQGRDRVDSFKPAVFSSRLEAWLKEFNSFNRCEKG